MCAAEKQENEINSEDTAYVVKKAQSKTPRAFIRESTSSQVVPYPITSTENTGKRGVRFGSPV